MNDRVSKRNTPVPALRPLLLAMAATGIYGGGIARAATYTVTNLNDDGPGSLRQTIATANGNPGSHHILFQNGLNGTITLTSGQIAITEPMEFLGPGADRLTISGGNNSRVFNINAGNNTVVLEGLRVADGNGRDTSPGDAQGPGGCIWADNTQLILFESVVTGCAASNSGGGIYMDDGGSKYGSVLGLFESTVSGNTVSCDNDSVGKYGCVGGGAVAPVVYAKYGAILDNAIIADGSFDDDISVAGGGAFAYIAVVSHSTVSGNTLGGNTNTNADADHARIGAGIAGMFAAAYNSTVDNNRILDNAGTVAGDSLFSGGGIAGVGSGMIVQSTVSGNAVPAGSHGAGVVMGSYFELDGGEGPFDGKYGILNSTITDNAGASAFANSGVIYGEGGTEFLMQSTIVANTVGGVDIHCEPECTVYGTHNLIRSWGVDVTFADATPLTADPQLGPLMYNGGFRTGAPGFNVGIRTHALAETSPAIDQGTLSDGPDLEYDQRDPPYPRFVGAGVDIGAYEWNPNEIPTLGAWSLGLLSSMLAFAGWRRRRRLH